MAPAPSGDRVLPGVMLHHVNASAHSRKSWQQAKHAKLELTYSFYNSRVSVPGNSISASVVPIVGHELRKIKTQGESQNLGQAAFQTTGNQRLHFLLTQQTACLQSVHDDKGRSTTAIATFVRQNLFVR